MLLLDWLLEGDIALRYKVHRDLLPNAPEVQIRLLRRRLGLDGWGKQLLDHFDDDFGGWGGGWYSPKWTGTHYSLMTLLDLRVPPENPIFAKGLEGLYKNLWLAGTSVSRDVCVAAMLLRLLAYAGRDEHECAPVLDYLLSTHMPDGGFNCRWNRGARVSSVHSSLTAMEGFQEYLASGMEYRRAEAECAITRAGEYLLRHRLFRRESDGSIIDERMLRFAWPARWYYDVLRALEFFADSGHPPDERMEEALDLLVSRQGKDGRWKNQNAHRGQSFFVMEKAGEPSRMNTYRALKVLKNFRPGLYRQIIREDY